MRRGGGGEGAGEVRGRGEGGCKPPVSWFDSKNCLKQQADRVTVQTIINPPKYKPKDYI